MNPAAAASVDKRVTTKKRGKTYHQHQGREKSHSPNYSLIQFDFRFASDLIG